VARIADNTSYYVVTH